MKIAAIDLGSNSIHTVIVEVSVELAPGAGQRLEHAVSEKIGVLRMRGA